MPTYDELKAELQNIAALLDSFPEPIKPQVFDLLIQQYLGIDPVDEVTGLEKRPEVETKKTPSRRKKASPKKAPEVGDDQEKPVKKKVSSKESYELDRELNLRGDKSIPSFSDFASEKSPNTAQEFNAVAVYYLQKILGLQKITLNHAYTCYLEVKRRPPEAFRQSFNDTKTAKGWVEFDGEGYLRAPHRGAVFVEHDLPIASGKVAAK